MESPCSHYLGCVHHSGQSSASSAGPPCTRGRFPAMVDNNFLRYYLIIHPADSPLAEPIAEALFNAVKKQYGLHSYPPLALPTSPLPAPYQFPPFYLVSLLPLQ
ncbi:hypothetical protein A0H81_00968 [Grifola frondosa]|uniref:Uncharacterized protein n=1 Tax=Grifola frondosa TaxID=5627 RepID=A0A1C7MR47_GRIFR|nr:hypothetical protein A0H81_00968 [Grifola frondosa]